MEFNHRVHAAGLTCYFTPALKIVYHPRQTWPALFRQLGRYGCGRARLAAKHHKSLTLPALVPPLWAVWLVVGAMAAAAVPLVGWAYLGSVLVYAAVIGAVSARLARGTPASVGVRVPAVFVGIHLGFAWGLPAGSGPATREALNRAKAHPRSGVGL